MVPFVFVLKLEKTVLRGLCFGLFVSKSNLLSINDRIFFRHFLEKYWLWCSSCLSSDLIWSFISSIYSMNLPFPTALTFKSATSFFNISMDFSCSDFLTASSFQISLNASHLELHLPDISIVASLVYLQWLSSSCRSSTRSF